MPVIPGDGRKNPIISFGIITRRPEGGFARTFVDFFSPGVSAPVSGGSGGEIQ